MAALRAPLHLLPLALGLGLLLALTLTSVAAKPNPEEVEFIGNSEDLSSAKIVHGSRKGLKLKDLEAELVDKVVKEDRQSYWSPDCPSGFYKYWSASNVVSICYRAIRTKRDWYAAKEDCQNMTPTYSRCFTSLASVMNINENDFIASVMNTENIYDHVWIGLNDRTNEGYFGWTDGRPYSYSNFYPGEPNNGNVNDAAGQPGEDCVELMYGYQGRWNDRSCTDQKYYVCKAFCV